MSAWDVAAQAAPSAAGAGAYVELGPPSKGNKLTKPSNPFAAKSRDGGVAGGRRGGRRNPFEVEDDLETALLSHEQEGVSQEERRLLSRIKNVKFITEEELIDEELQARESQMASLNSDVHKIHEVFSDLRQLVSDQGESIDQVESDVEAAHGRAENGVKQLAQAARHQKGGMKCTIVVLAVCAVIIVVIVVVAVLGEKYGKYAL